MNDSDSSAQNGLTRRELLGLLGAGALAALLPAGLPGQAHAANNADFDTAKGPGLIFVVGDGMPAGVVRAMHEVRTGVFGRANTALHSRLRDPRSALGLMATASLSSIVTDSAPASAAWSTGVHTANRHLAALPDGRPLTTIFELVRKRGVATGLVTTTRVTHATPAAWISHQTNRDLEDDIASEILAFRPEVLLGGGFRHFSAAKRKDGRDLLAEFQRSGCDTVTDRAGLLAATAAAKPLVGLFSASHLAYNLDRLNDPALSAQPTLPEMTAQALRRLAKNPNGFLLQVEAGRIDHACHSNDAWSSIMDTVELDDTLAVIDSFLAVNPKTLVIVTSDHGNSGWGINGTGSSYNDATAALRSYRAGKASFEAIIRRLKGKNAQQTQDILTESTGFAIGLDEAEMVLAAMEPGYGGFTGDYVYQPDATIGLLLARNAKAKDGKAGLRRGNVGFTSTNHTAEDQTLLAYGHRARELNLARLLDNTELFDTMCAYFGLRHTNPRMAQDEAARLLLSTRQDADPRLHIA